MAVPLGYVITSVGMNLHVDALGGDYILVGNIAALSTFASLILTLLAPSIMALLKPSVTLLVFVSLVGVTTLAITIAKNLIFDIVLFPAMTAADAVRRVVWMHII